MDKELESLVVGWERTFMEKAGSSHNLTRTVWVRFPPSQAHEMCLLAFHGYLEMPFMAA